MNYYKHTKNTHMDKNSQTELMTAMAEAVPLKILFKQVNRAIKDYEDDPTELSIGFVVFTMQIALMRHIIEKGDKTADELKSEITRNEQIMNLFKENNN